MEKSASRHSVTTELQQRVAVNCNQPHPTTLPSSASQLPTVYAVGFFVVSIRMDRTEELQNLRRLLDKTEGQEGQYERRQEILARIAALESEEAE